MTRFVLLAALAASPISAAAPLAQAQFAPGAELPARVVVGESLWTCGAGRCAGPGEGRTVAMQRACTTLARQIGPVTSFTAGANALTAEAIQVCNAKAGHAAPSLAAR